MPFFLPKLDKTMAVVTVTITRRDPKTGQTVTEELEGVPSPEFQRFWQTQALTITTPGGGISFPPEPAADPYDSAQMQRVINALAAIYQ